MSNNEGSVKKFGLVPMKKKDNPPVVPRVNLSDDSEPNLAQSNAQPKAPPRSIFESKISREEQATIAKALEEDATLYEYDAVYEADKQKIREATQPKNSEQQEERKPKYVFGLFRSAAIRQLENERREERKIQKELENETTEKTECFVTESYRRKLEEIRQLEEVERRNEAANEEAARFDPMAINRLLLAQRTGEKLPDAARKDEDAAQRVQIQKKILNLGNRQFRKRKSAASGSDSGSDSDSESQAASDSESHSDPEPENENEDLSVKKEAVTIKKEVKDEDYVAAAADLVDVKKENVAESVEKTEDDEDKKTVGRKGESAIETLKRQLETREERIDRWKSKCARRCTEESLEIARAEYFERKALRDATRDYIEVEQPVK